MKRIKLFIGLALLIAITCLLGTNLTKNNTVYASANPSITMDVPDTIYAGQEFDLVIKVSAGDTALAQDNVGWSSLTVNFSLNGLEGYEPVTYTDEYGQEKSQYTLSTDAFTNRANKYHVKSNYKVYDESYSFGGQTYDIKYTEYTFILSELTEADDRVLVKDVPEFTITIPVKCTEDASEGFDFAFADIPDMTPVNVLFLDDGTTNKQYDTQIGNLDLGAVEKTFNVSQAQNQAELAAATVNGSNATINETNITATVGAEVDTANLAFTAKSNGKITSVKDSEGNEIAINNGTYPLSLNEAGNDTTATVVVSSQDDTASETYTITISREEYDVATLSALVVEGATTEDTVEFSPSFVGDSESNVNYNIGVAHDCEGVYITPTITSGYGISENITITGVSGTVTSGSRTWVPISENQQNITIVVEAQNGDTTTYTLKIVRSNDTSLDIKNLTVSKLDGSSVTGLIAVSKNDNDYTATIGFTEATGFKVEAEADDSSSTITFNPTNQTKTFSSVEDEELTVVITVTNTDGISKEYNITITRTGDTDATLKELKFMVNGTDLLGGTFKHNEKNYITIAADETAVNGTIEATTNSVNATIVSGTGEADIPSTGSSELRIEVQPASGEKKTYYIVLEREVPGSPNNNITSIVVTDGTKSDYITYASDDYEYEVNLPYNIAGVTIAVELEDPDATCTGHGTYTLEQGGEVTATIQAKAQNNSLGQEYKIVIKRAKADNNAYLTALSFDGVPYAGLTQSTKNVKLRVEHDQDKIVIDATACDLATIPASHLGEKPLDLGKNEFSIVVTAQDGTTTHTVYITIHRAEDKNTITGITISGTDYVFDSNVTNPATINVLYNVNTVDFTVTTDALYGKISVEGTKRLDEGENTFEVFVTSEYGTEGTKYIIVIDRAPASDNNYLSSLVVKIDGVDKIVDFDKTKDAYAIENVEATSSINLSVSATAEHPGASITGTGPVTITFEQSIVIHTVTVTAENGEQRPYRIYVSTGEIDLDGDNSISSIKITGIDDDYVYFETEFNSATTPYEITVPYTVNSIFVEVGSATLGNIYGKGKHNIDSSNYLEFDVYATSQLGIEGQRYTFKITREKADSDSSLSELLFNGGLISEFSPTKYTYNKSVNNTMETVDIVATPKLATSTVIISVEGQVHTGIKIPLAAGEATVITIMVTAADKSTSTYTVTVNRAGADGSLDELYIDKVSFADADGKTIVFSKDVLTYYATVEFSFTEVLVCGSSLDPNMEINGLGNIPLIVGKQEIKVVATPRTGYPTVYTIVVIRKAEATNTTSINTITIPQLGTFAASFNDEINEYDGYTVASNVTSLSFDIVFNKNEFEDAPTWVTLGNELKFGHNTVVLIITSPDQTTRRTILIHVVREDVKIESISVKQIGALAIDFSNDVDSYSYKVSSTVTNLDFEITCANENDSYEINTTEIKSGANIITITLKNGEEVNRVIYITVQRGAAPAIYDYVIAGVAVVALLAAFIVFRQKKKKL